MSSKPRIDDQENLSRAVTAIIEKMFEVAYGRFENTLQANPPSASTHVFGYIIRYDEQELGDATALELDTHEFGITPPDEKTFYVMLSTVLSMAVKLDIPSASVLAAALDVLRELNAQQDERVEDAISGMVN